MILNVDNSEVKEFTKKLQQMHRSNIPIAIRQTLNDLAFDVKKNTLLQSADKLFILRNPSFFRSHSGVKKAVGFNIKSMQSEVGILTGSTAAEGLKKQEFGGTTDKSMIYMDTARTGQSKSKTVRRSNYFNKKEIVGGKPLSGYGMRSRKSNFVAAAFMAKKTNKFVLWENTLYEIKSIRFGRGGKNRKVYIKSNPIADYEKNRKVAIHAKPFLKPASEISSSKTETFYIKNAKKRIEKGLK